jgi:hypothetical protein
LPSAQTVISLTASMISPRCVEVVAII